MKTKELIRQLLNLDPTGEADVCVGNADIHLAERLSAYYDGPLQILERGGKQGYDIIGGGSNYDEHEFKEYLCQN